MFSGYRVLVTHFEDLASPERRPKPTAAVVGRAKKMAKYLTNYEDLLFMAFMLDALEHLSYLSLTFQKDCVSVDEAREALFTCLLNLEELKTTPGQAMTEVLTSAAQTDSFRQIQLKNVTPTTLAEKRKKVIGKSNTILRQHILQCNDSQYSKTSILSTRLIMLIVIFRVAVG